MPLSTQNLQDMLSGFQPQEYRFLERPTSAQNPVHLDVRSGNGSTLRFRLWVFEITHGGGDRSAEESRIQITNAPAASSGLDHGGVTDLILGYSPSRQVIAAYDRRWLEKRMIAGSGSPSVQLRESEFAGALANGMHRISKSAAFGAADIVTMTPALFPKYLEDHAALLSGAAPLIGVSASTPATPQSVWEYCLSAGYYFEPDLLARYIAAIATKPFVILAGISGAGKSKMAELVAEYYSATSGSAATGSSADAEAVTGSGYVFEKTETSNRLKPRFTLVPVRPDWIDNQSVLGYVNPITGRYESTQALDLMLRAQADYQSSTDKAAAPRHFILLDEMNLARVEHYFSDWLACSESRRPGPTGEVVQQCVPLHRHAVAVASVSDAEGVMRDVNIPTTVEIPTNVIVTGTVNIDETTFGFSPKVLDRSMVIEFNAVDLEGVAVSAGSSAAAVFRFPLDLPPFRLPTLSDFKGLPVNASRHLVAINKILEDAQLHFGYRSAAEIGVFMEIYHSILPADPADADMLRAMDGAVLQKVLPRIQGNRARIEHSLMALLRYFRDLDTVAPDDLQVSSVAKLPQSYLRGFEMLDRLRSFGFTTFFR